MHRNVVAAVVVAIALPLFGAGSAAGADVTAANRGTVSAVRPARVDHVEQITDRRTAVFIDSPSMGRIVQVQILHPAGGGARPALYMLDGVSAGEESDYRESTWTQRTDIVDFFADKNVNVVLPVGGTASYYTNWQRPDPVLGTNEWETFLAKELPPLVDSRFSGNGVNAIAGVSMGATGAMNLITRHPELYRGVASLSGCPDNGRDASMAAVRTTVAYKGGDATNMWGGPGDPAWLAHDPLLNAERLRGKSIFVTTGTGLPGPHDADTDALTVGGPLEAAALVCTTLFDGRLRQLGIPATFVYRPYGTHSWPYWQDDLRTAWPTLKQALVL